MAAVRTPGAAARTTTGCVPLASDPAPDRNRRTTTNGGRTIEVTERRRRLSGSGIRTGRGRLAGVLAVCLVAALAGPAVQATAGGRPAVRPTGHAKATYLIFGDSTAFTLGMDLEVYASAVHDRVNLVDDGQLGCGVAEGSFIMADGQPVVVPAVCNPATPPAGQWPAILARDLLADRPRVVVLLAGRWEVFDRSDAAGEVTDITRPAYARYVEEQLQRFVRIASSRGGRVVLMTAPYYQPPGGKTGPEDAPVRVDEYNRLVRDVVRANPATTSLFRLNALVSPQGRYAATIGSQLLRAPDGVHFPFFTLGDPEVPEPDSYFQVLQFGEWLGPRVLPYLADQAR